MNKASRRFINAFTLVELIVVVTILAILATIGFVSYSSYLTWVRDTNRLAQLVSIHDWLELYSTKNELPVPDENIELKVNVSATDYSIWFQWYAWTNTLQTLDFTQWWQDPRDGQYFSYMLTKDRKNFQLMALLEEDQSLQSHIFWSVNALDYSNRIPTVYGDALWIITNEENTPVQAVVSWEILLNGTWINYVAHMADNDTRTWNSSDILYWAYLEIAGKSNTSCKNILSKHPYVFWTDWAYWIDIGQETMKLPCDMTTDGWGWTLVLHGNDSDIEKYDARGANSWQFSETSIPFIGEELSFKLSDRVLNDVRGEWQYMSVASRLLDNNTYKYFTPSSCDYNHEVWDNGTCSELYTDTTYSTPISCTWNVWWKWIGCWNPPWSQWIVTNYSSNLSTAVCFNPWAWCTWGWAASTDPMTIKLFVR